MRDENGVRVSEIMQGYYREFERTLGAAEGICKKQCYEGSISCIFWGNQGCILPKIRELLTS